MGTATNCTPLENSFEIITKQYTSFYIKDESILLICVTFNSNKYKLKVPMPSVDTFVAIEGLLFDVETDDNGLPIMFNVSV
jgi:hypothetical protein